MKSQKGSDFMENKNLIDKAIEFIQSNPKENLSLQSIADNARFSLTYFDMIFQKHTGYSPVEYSRVYKLTRSALDLKRTNKSVIDVALDYGYASPESFTRAFKAFYGISPSEYRTKYSKAAVTWHDLSGKISISHFKRSFPELKSSDIDMALDFCFTHNPLKHGEDIIGMTVAETEILTLGDAEQLDHFVYVSDYNSVEPVVTIVAENETDALPYLTLFAKLSNPRFSVRKGVDSDWEHFDAETAKLGLTCRCAYDMIYSGGEIAVPDYEGMSARLLTVADMSHIEAFKRNGSCAECHVRAIQIHFDGKGNESLKPVGVFADGKLVCLAMPTFDRVRELLKCDIGAIFAIEKNGNKAIDLMWKYVINLCSQENAVIGNANAYEDDSPLGVAICERLGLVKVAKNCIYRK